jgi:putative ATP-dependent endonuclease of OLD family
MYLSEIKLWNFRKYGNGKFDLKKPDLIVPLHKGLNVLIGENDSGKTAIIDAVKLVLKTHAFEWIRVEEDDFFKESTQLRIELEFAGIEPEEGKNFIEWLGWRDEGKLAAPFLRLILQAERDEDRIKPSEVRAGVEGQGSQMSLEAKEYLKVTYLRPLRDAEADLIPKRNSRLAQILRHHPLFDGKSKNHALVEAFEQLNVQIKNYFRQNGEGKVEITDKIDGFLKKFISDSAATEFDTGKTELLHIFEKLALNVGGVMNPGLGTLNRLYMAFELLHLQKKNWTGLRLGLIEELEAHLHPQAQMKVIEALQDETEVQFLLTTHSPNLASKVKLKNLILCNGGNVYPLGSEIERTEDGKIKPDRYTKLEPSDQAFLEYFLDVTKANLFFARGVILVEGWSEELLIPVIADKIGCNLTKHEVSIVNVGSTAYKRYSKIFLRADGKELAVPVAVVIDLDIRPDNDGIFDEAGEKAKKAKFEKSAQGVRVFVSKQWTLEWCIAKSKIGGKFQQIVTDVHPKTSGYRDDFMPTLSKNLMTNNLDKTDIAARLALDLKDNLALINENDEWLKYLMDAIRHACGKEVKGDEGSIDKP